MSANSPEDERVPEEMWNRIQREREERGYVLLHRHLDEEDRATHLTFGIPSDHPDAVDSPTGCPNDSDLDEHIRPRSIVREPCPMGAQNRPSAH